MLKQVLDVIKEDKADALAPVFRTGELGCWSAQPLVDVHVLVQTWYRRGCSKTKILFSILLLGTRVLPSSTSFLLRDARWTQ
jgi:hypothetical protein